MVAGGWQSGRPTSSSPAGTRLLRVLQNSHLGWSPGVALCVKYLLECVCVCCVVHAEREKTASLFSFPPQPVHLWLDEFKCRILGLKGL